MTAPSSTVALAAWTKPSAAHPPRVHASVLNFADQRVADPELSVALAEAVRAAAVEPQIRTAAASVIAAHSAAL